MLVYYLSWHYVQYIHKVPYNLGGCDDVREARSRMVLILRRLRVQTERRFRAH